MQFLSTKEREFYDSLIIELILTEVAKLKKYRCGSKNYRFDGVYAIIYLRWRAILIY